MQRAKENALSLAVLFMDLVVVALGLWTAFWVRTAGHELFGVSPFQPMAELRLLGYVLATHALALSAFSWLRWYLRRPPSREILALGRACLLSVLLFLTVTYFLKDFATASLGRLTVVIAEVTIFVFLVAERSLLRRFFVKGALRRRNFRSCVVVGTDSHARAMQQIIDRAPYMKRFLYGFFATSTGEADNPSVPDSMILGPISKLVDFVQTKSIGEVFFVATKDSLHLLPQVTDVCTTFGIKLYIKLALESAVEPGNLRLTGDRLGNMELVTLSNVPEKYMALKIKRVADIVISLALLIFTAPLMLLTVLLIRATSPGPAIFKQERCGAYGRQFQMYKIRSMRMSADSELEDLRAQNEMDGPVFKIRDDPRVTPIGRFLRRYSIDELPQLFNVLIGDMSLVGPRPPVPGEVRHYELWQRRRLSVKPGLTCIWQTSGRNRISFDKWMKQDLAYIDNWTLWLDLKLLLKTILVVFTGKGAS